MAVVLEPADVSEGFNLAFVAGKPGFDNLTQVQVVK